MILVNSNDVISLDLGLAKCLMFCELLSKSKICTSPRYGFELSADAQRIAITLSHTKECSKISAKNKFCSKFSSHSP